MCMYKCVHVYHIRNVCTVLFKNHSVLKNLFLSQFAIAINNTKFYISWILDFASILNLSGIFFSLSLILLKLHIGMIFSGVCVWVLYLKLSMTSSIFPTEPETKIECWYLLWKVQIQSNKWKVKKRQESMQEDVLVLWHLLITNLKRHRNLFSSKSPCSAWKSPVIQMEKPCL